MCNLLISSPRLLSVFWIILSLNFFHFDDHLNLSDVWFGAQKVDVYTYACCMVKQHMRTLHCKDCKATADRLHSRWKRGELQATSSDRVEARSHIHACNNGIYHSGDHGQIPWLSLTFGRLEIRRCPEWLGCDLQSACRRMGTDLGIHGFLRGFSGSVSWNPSCSRRLWIQGVDSI